MINVKIEQLPEEFIKATPVIETLEKAGFEAYFVGGSVRDIMMNKPIHDVDIATSAYPEEVQNLFHKTFDLGVEHGTVLVLIGDEQYEVTTFRTESTYQDYRRPDQVTFVRSLEEDLKRRDFCMNALAMNRHGEVIDLFDGLYDIKHQQIRAVGVAEERFNEDALRMMRAVRFASQLDFHIEGKTQEAIYHHHHLLTKISMERIQMEWIKLLAGKNPKRGLNDFIATNCYQSCQGMEDKKEALIYLAEHLTQSVNEAQGWLILSLVFQFDEHQAQKFMRAWKCSKAMIQLVEPCIEGVKQRLHRPLTPVEQYDLGIERLALIESVLFFFDVPINEHYQQDYEELAIHKIQDVAVDGKQLIQQTNRKPGPWMGQFLRQTQEKILMRQWPNDTDFLLEQAQQFDKQEGIV